MSSRTHVGNSSRRRGAAVVELAVVLPIFVLLVIGAMDVGRAIMVRHKIVEAARAGCRLHAVQDIVSYSDVAAAIEKVLDDAGLTGYTFTLDPESPGSIDHLAPVTASVSIPYEEVSWLPYSWFLGGRTLSAKCVMPGDTGVFGHSPGS